LIDRRFEVSFGGSGGQGVVRSSIILVAAAKRQFADKIYVLQSQSYDAVMRGLPTSSYVILSPEWIDYPKVKNPDVLVALDKTAYVDHINDVREDGLAIYEQDLVKGVDLRSYIAHYPVPATTLAENAGAGRIAANMVMLGALSAATRLVDLGPLREEVIKQLPKHAQKNTKALEAGFEYAKERPRPVVEAITS
jgi:2-oxoglutarate ferredoxin oxidoreductase subunit gamma